jgi:hypothetical protein
MLIDPVYQPVSDRYDGHGYRPLGASGLRVKPVWLGFYDFAAERNQTRAQLPWCGCFVARK